MSIIMLFTQINAFQFRLTLRSKYSGLNNLFVAKLPYVYTRLLIESASWVLMKVVRPPPEKALQGVISLMITSVYLFIRRANIGKESLSSQG